MRKQKKLNISTVNLFGIEDELQKKIYESFCSTTPMARDLTTLSAIASKVAKEHYIKVRIMSI